MAERREQPWCNKALPPFRVVHDEVSSFLFLFHESLRCLHFAFTPEAQNGRKDTVARSRPGKRGGEKLYWARLDQMQMAVALTRNCRKSAVPDWRYAPVVRELP